MVGKRALVLLLLVSVLGSVVAEPVPLAGRLSLYPESPDLPFDATIGPLVDPEPDSIEWRTVQAAKQPWGPDWIEAYVQPSFRNGFAHSFNALLASVLPLDDVRVASARQEGDGYVVGVRSGVESPRYLSFVWRKQEGLLFLVSVSFEEPTDFSAR